MLMLIVCIITSIIGLIYCFFGCRHIRKLISIMAFFSFGFTAFVLLGGFTTLTLLVRILIGVGAGILGAALSYFLFKVGLFISGAYFGFSLASLLMALIKNVPNWLNLVVCVILAILFGILVIKLRRPLIIISTSFSGGVSLTLFGGYLCFNISTMFNGVGVKAASVWDTVFEYFCIHLTTMLPILLAVIVGGLIIQFTLTAPKD